MAILPIRKGILMSDYNGWTNRETWLVHLWLGEDDYIGQMQNGNGPAHGDVSAQDIIIYIKSWVAKRVEEPRNSEYGFWADMKAYDSKASDINFDELAESLAHDINCN